MAAIVGREPLYADPVPKVNLPKIRRTAPFRFTHHPTQWDIAELSNGKLCWFPILGKQQVDPGVNGVDERGDDLHSRDWHGKNGIVILNIPYREYIVEIDTVSGISFREKWEKIHVSGGKQIIQYDRAGYQQFVFSLIERGLLAHEPEPPVAAILLQEWQQKLDRAYGEYAKKAYPGLEVRIQSLKKKIDFVEGKHERKQEIAGQIRENAGQSSKTR